MVVHRLTCRRLTCRRLAKPDQTFAQLATMTTLRVHHIDLSPAIHAWQSFGVTGNLIAGGLGAGATAAWRSGHNWRTRRDRGQFFQGMATGKIVVVRRQRGDVPVDELRAAEQLTTGFRDLHLAIEPESFFADQTEAIRPRDHLLVIGTPADNAMIEMALRAVGLTTRALVPEGAAEALSVPDESINGPIATRLQASACLVVISARNHPGTISILLTGDSPRACWAAARWMTSDAFRADPFVRSGRPFLHHLTFSDAGTPETLDHQGRYLAEFDGYIGPP